MITWISSTNLCVGSHVLKVNNHIPLPNFTWVKTLDTFYGCYKYTFTVMIHDFSLDVRTRSYVNLHTSTLLLDVLYHKKVTALYNMDFMRGITLYGRFIQPWIEIIWFPIAIIWHMYSLKPSTFWTPIGRYDPWCTLHVVIVTDVNWKSSSTIKECTRVLAIIYREWP